MKTKIAAVAVLCLSAFCLSAFAQTGATTENKADEARPVPLPLSPATQQTIAAMTPLFDGKTLAGWETSSNAWIVKDGAMASTGG